MLSAKLWPFCPRLKLLKPCSYRQLTVLKSPCPALTAGENASGWHTIKMLEIPIGYMSPECIAVYPKCTGHIGIPQSIFKLINHLHVDNNQSQAMFYPNITVLEPADLDCATVYPQSHGGDPLGNCVSLRFIEFPSHLCTMQFYTSS